jgi:chromosome segregation ATPase
MLRIRELEEEISQKNKDLILAAEIGSRVLQEKIQLENSIKIHLSKVQDLNNVVGELEALLSDKDVEISNLRISVKNLEKNCKENQYIITNLKEKLDFLLKETETITGKKLKLESSAREMALEVSSLKLELENAESENIEIHKKYSEISTNFADLFKSKQELLEKLQESVQENSDLKIQVGNYEAEIVKLQKEFEISKIELENSKVLKVEENSSTVQFSFGSSLLGEIDEKRIQAEIEAKETSQKHEGLLKNYNLISRQKERMKNHISRLTQLSQKQSVEHRLLVLESELSQALSENQDLKEKLLSFKHVRQASEESLDLEEKSLVAKLLQENNRLSQEIKTLHMLKLNEADKVRSAYSLLHVKEQELDALRSEFAQVKYELDEAQLKLHNPDFIQEDPNQSVFEKELDSPEKSIQAREAEGSVKNSINASFNSSAGSDEEIQKVIQSLSGVSTPSSDSEILAQERPDTNSPIVNQQSSRNIKVDRAKIGQECNQQ